MTLRRTYTVYSGAILNLQVGYLITCREVINICLLLITVFINNNDTSNMRKGLRNKMS